jgi:Ca2+-binding RTX toxin-like protein
MSIKDLDTNHADTTYEFSLNGTDFAVGGENSSQDPDNCIRIQDVQGLDTFDFHLIRQGLTISLDQNGGTSYVTDLVGGPEAKIICESLIENATGGTANDCIKGNDYSNVLNGGRGGDDLTGCGGSDTFTYTGVNASLNSAGLFDTIQDFEHGIDLINVHGIDANHNKFGDQNFKFIGSSNFHHQAGELRVTSNNVILADTDGDGHADFKIKVLGDHVQGSDIFL